MNARAAIAAIVTALVAASAAYGARTPTPTIYWGAHIGDNYGLGTDAPWNTAAMPDFAQQMGKAPSLVEFGVWWAGSCAWAPCYSSALASFPAAQMQAIRSYGAIPVLDWASADATKGLSQPSYTDKAIASGAFDAYITQFARDARAWGHPFFLRLDWEMNGAWWPWSVGANGNSAVDFVAAWKHVHAIFASQGATLVDWLWTVNVEPGSSTPFASEYPGSSYVDWIGVDGYDNGSLGFPNGSFASVFGQTLSDINAAGTGKKVMIAEIGSQDGPNKPQFIADSLAGAQADGVSGYVYMDKNESPHSWRIDSSAAALAAFKAGIASSAFAANAYGGITAAP